MTTTVGVVGLGYWGPNLARNFAALPGECRHFLDCIAERRAPLSDGESGLRVVRVLERLQDDLDGSRRAAAVREA